MAVKYATTVLAEQVRKITASTPVQQLMPTFYDRPGKLARCGYRRWRERRWRRVGVLGLSSCLEWGAVRNFLADMQCISGQLLSADVAMEVSVILATVRWLPLGSFVCVECVTTLIVCSSSFLSLKIALVSYQWAIHYQSRIPELGRLAT